ncbi:MAG TPA: arsenate reductase ArsC [Anaerolineae bacterium]|nr:arsenate reductase ArsC [Anaerolineae bacterium]
MTKQVLILCTGNSCRSQMAAGLVNHYLGDEWEAVSAGTKPAGYVHPLAVAAMAELGIDISGYQSEVVDLYREWSFAVVITVCAEAAEDCPLWLGEGDVVHIGFDDPAEARGSEAEQMAVFGRVRDEIRGQVLPFLREWDE